MRILINSSYWLFFYSFFIISFVPYFFIRFDHQTWIYNLLYRPNGIVENMTVLLYGIVVFLTGKLLFKYKVRDWAVIAVFIGALFMIGEETRWGLGFLTEDIRDLPLTSVQDILMFAVKGTPENAPTVLIWFMFCMRIFLFCIVGGGSIALWYDRHRWSSWRKKALSYTFTPYIFVYMALMLGVIILELFIQPGVRKFDYLEENFELNAAIILMLLSYELSAVSPRQ